MEKLQRLANHVCLISRCSPSEHLGHANGHVRMYIRDVTAKGNTSTGARRYEQPTYPRAYLPNVLYAYALHAVLLLHALYLLYECTCLMRTMTHRPALPAHPVHHTSTSELYYLHHLRSCAIPNAGGGGSTHYNTPPTSTSHPTTASFAILRELMRDTAALRRYSVSGTRATGTTTNSTARARRGRGQASPPETELSKRKVKAKVPEQAGLLRARARALPAMAREGPTVVRKVETRVVREDTRCSPLLKSTTLLSHSTPHSTVTDYQPQHKSLGPPLFLLLLSSTIKLLTIRMLAGMATMAAVAEAERLTGVSREWIHRVDNVRYDIDIMGLLTSGQEHIQPVVVGMPVLKNARDAHVKIATWNVAGMSATETSLAYMTTVLNSSRIDVLVLTETHLADDLLVGRLRSMNWNVEVRERDNASTGGVHCTGF